MQRFPSGNHLYSRFRFLLERVVRREVTAFFLVVTLLQSASAIPPKPGAGVRAGVRDGSRRNDMVLAPSALHELTKGAARIPVLVIPAQFPDLRFTYGTSYLTDMLSKSGYDYSGATGSVADYFNDQYGGRAEFSFELGPVVSLPHSYSYYGRNDSAGDDLRPAEMVSDACRLADDQLDFSRYKYICVIYAGGNPADGSADDEHIWPHSWSLTGAGMDLTLDGVKIDSYAATSEMDEGGFAAIGTFCHEFAHLLGLPDMYDTDYGNSGGEAGSLEYTSLMAYGCYSNDGNTPPLFNAMELELLGLAEPEPVGTGKYTLDASSRRVLRLDTDTEGEYYLLERRMPESWDKYIRGGGLLVYHVDKSGNPAGYSTGRGRDLTASERWQYNEVNCRPDHPCALIVSPSDDNLFWPYGTRDCLLSSDFSFWNGMQASTSVKSITKYNGVLSFEVFGPLVFDEPDVFQDAAILGWTSGFPGNPCNLTVKRNGAAERSVTVEEYSDGMYSCTLENLLPGTEYEVMATVSGGLSTSISFTTKEYAGHPYIYMGDLSTVITGEIRKGQRLPLRVMNVPGDKTVSWTFDGEDITVASDGYWTMERSGVLRAEVKLAGGDAYIIVKELKVK